MIVIVIIALRSGILTKGYLRAKISWETSNTSAFYSSKREREKKKAHKIILGKMMVCHLLHVHVDKVRKTVHLHLFDGSFQLSDLTLYGLLIGQDEADSLGNLVL